MSNAYLDWRRMAEMLETDAVGNVRNTLRVAQSDVMDVLREFMEVKKLDMRIDRAGNGFKLTIHADVERIYDVGKLDGGA